MSDGTPDELIEDIVSCEKLKADAEARGFVAGLCWAADFLSADAYRWELEAASPSKADALRTVEKQLRAEAGRRMWGLG